MANVCVDSNTFFIFMLINILIIFYCLYQSTASTKDQIEKILDQKLSESIDDNNTENKSQNITPQNIPQQNISQNLPYENKIPIFIPTRGEPTEFYIVGFLSDKKNSDHIMKLYERHLYNGRYEYCTDHHINQTIRIPLPTHNYEQLTDGDIIRIPGYNGKFIVHIYPRDTPRYLGVY